MARAGARAAANAASSASAAVLHPARATVAQVSSQVARRGSSRAASGRAAAAASAGITSGRDSRHTPLLLFLFPIKIVGGGVPVGGRAGPECVPEIPEVGCGGPALRPGRRGGGHGA